MDFKIKPNRWLWVVGILLFMAIYPGTGTKAASQEAIVSTPLSCTTYKDCPTCMGGFSGQSETSDPANLSFFDELNYAKCTAGKCQLSEYCVYWSCGTQPESVCTNVRRTLFDNTFGQINKHPEYLLYAGLAIAAILML